MLQSEQLWDALDLHTITVVLSCRAINPFKSCHSPGNIQPCVIQVSNILTVSFAVGSSKSFHLELLSGPSPSTMPGIAGRLLLYVAVAKVLLKQWHRGHISFDPLAHWDLLQVMSLVLDAEAHFMLLPRIGSSFVFYLAREEVLYGTE